MEFRNQEAILKPSSNSEYIIPPQNWQIYLKFHFLYRNIMTMNEQYLSGRFWLQGRSFIWLIALIIRPPGRQMDLLPSKEYTNKCGGFDTNTKYFCKHNIFLKSCIPLHLHKHKYSYTFKYSYTIGHNRHNRQWCTFFNLFSTYNAKNWACFGQFWLYCRELTTFGRTFHRPK